MKGPFFFAVKFLSLLLSISLVFAGCKKDHSLDCNPLPQPNNGGYSAGWNYTSTQSFNYAPSFNPKNGNQFAFLQKTAAGTVLNEYDNTSHTLITLFTGNIFYQPDWGVNGWILFDINNDIYKIKFNGDSLTQLTTGGISCGPKWSPDANEYIYYLYGGIGSGGTLIAAPSGQVVDSFSIGFGRTSAWKDSNLVSGGGCGGFLVFNTITYRQNRFNYYSDCLPGTSGLCFINSSTIIWSDNGGIYLTNVQTEQTTKIKSTCDSKTYICPGYSSLSNKVIWNKIVQTPVNSTTLNITSTIVIMNPDGTNEQEIEIP